MSGRSDSQVVPIGEVPPEDTNPYHPVVMVVDDEVIIADTLAEILTRNGYAAVAAYDGEEALETALLTPPEMLIADVMLPGMNGIELAVIIQRTFPDCKILLFSGRSVSNALLAPAERAGYHFSLLSKPVHPDVLLATVSESLRQVGTTAA